MENTYTYQNRLQLRFSTQYIVIAAYILSSIPCLYSQETSTPLPLADFLESVEEIYDLSFIYENELLDEYVTSYLLDKTLRLEPQLKELLKGYDLELKKISYKTYAIIRKVSKVKVYGKITDARGSPLYGATISIMNIKEWTTSDLNGEYQLFIPQGTYTLTASYVGCEDHILTIDDAVVDDYKLDVTLKDLAPLEQIVVVGLKLKQVSLLKTTLATNVVQAKNLPHSANTELGDLLQNSVPSFHSTPQTISDGTDHIDPATLKGLGSDQILVLINGKRRHHSSLVNVNGTIGRGSVATDLNSIPLSAIERIEVLRDGASTQYGSDAIAGVINVILKESVGVINLKSYAGTTAEGDGQTIQLSGNYGLAIGKENGFLNLNFDFMNRGSTDRSGNYTGLIYGDSRDNNPLDVQTFFDNIDLEDRRVMPVGQAQSTNGGLFFNMAFPISDSFKLYSFGGLNYRVGRSGAFYRFPYQEHKQAGIHPLGFAPNINTDIFDRSISIGTKGEINNWKLDFSNTIGSNSIYFNIKNSNNASQGLASPSEAKAGGFQYTQSVTNLDLQKKIDFLNQTELGIGTELRIENYEQFRGEESSWKLYDEVGSNGEPKEAGIQSFPGFRPENETDQFRFNFGINADLDISISEPILIGIASRMEYYQDFGSNISWRLNARYKLSSKASIRSSINTGFRAPSMPQIYFSSTSLQFISQGTEQVGAFVTHFNNSDPTARAFGIDPLKAESSINYNVGISNSIQNLTTTLDLYKIKIQNRIVTTGRFAASEDQRFAEILEPINVSQAQFFSNAVDTETYGLDFSLRYKYLIGKNELKFSAMGNITKTRVQQDENGNSIIKTSDLLSDYKSTFFNREEISRIEVAQPQNKFIFSLVYRSRKLDFYLGAIRFGEVNYIHPEDGDPANWVLNTLNGEIESRDQTFSAKWITNTNLKYTITNKMNFTLGIDNVFNVFPDKHTHSANIGDGIFLYSRRVSQFGLKGRFWYSKLQIRL